MPALGPAVSKKPATVSAQLADVLREAIADGSLHAGSALRQDELAEKFGFSRMPIRDALRQLEAEGLVDIHPTKGAFVARMDAKEIDDIYAVRELLEAEALRLSTPLLSSEPLDRAARILDRLDVESDVGKWGVLNRDFHLELYALCGNQRLLDLIAAQHIVAERYVRLLLSNLDYRTRSQVEHRELLRACQAKDAAGAVKALRKHLREGGRTLAKAVGGETFARRF